MNSGNEEIHKKKKSNSTWTGFFSLLIIFHLPIILPLIYSILTYPRDYPLAPIFALRVHPLTNLLLPLAIIDFITAISYIKKQSPPWIAFFVSLFAVDAIFFHWAGMALRKSAGGVGAIVIIPLALMLLIIDLTTILFYVIRTNPQGRAKAISYTALIVISSVLIYAFLFDMPFL